MKKHPTSSLKPITPVVRSRYSLSLCMPCRRCWISFLLSAMLEARFGKTMESKILEEQLIIMIFVMVWTRVRLHTARPVSSTHLLSQYLVPLIMSYISSSSHCLHVTARALSFLDVHVAAVLEASHSRHHCMYIPHIAHVSNTHHTATCHAKAAV